MILGALCIVEVFRIRYIFGNVSTHLFRFYIRFKTLTPLVNVFQRRSLALNLTRDLFIVSTFISDKTIKLLCTNIYLAVFKIKTSKTPKNIGYF